MPLIECCSVVWWPYLLHDVDKIEGVQPSWGGDLSSCVRASDFIVSINNIAVVCAFEPRGIPCFLFTVCCQCALSVVCLRLILTLVVKA